MRLIMLSAMIQGLTGSANLSTSTGSSVGLHLLERSTGVFVEKDICITRHDLPAGQPGRGTTPFPCVVIVDLGDFTCLLLLSVLWTFCGLVRQFWWKLLCWNLALSPLIVCLIQDEYFITVLILVSQILVVTYMVEKFMLSILFSFLFWK